MCLKVRTSFAANSEVVAGVDTVEPRNNMSCSSLTISKQTHLIIETAALYHPPHSSPLHPVWKLVSDAARQC